MAIVKTHLFNISFAHQDLMKVLIKIDALKEEIFPQNAKQIANNVKGVSVFEENNPYNELLEQVYHLCDRLGMEKPLGKIQYQEFNIEEVKEQIRSIEKQIEQVVEVREKLEIECHENEEAMQLLKGMHESYINIDDIQECQYLSYRIGKLPIEQVEKIKYYREYPFIFKKLHEENMYVWVIYAAIKKNLSEIDNVFYALSFEEIHLPDFVHGTMKDAYQELQIEVVAMKQYIEEVNTHLEEVKLENEAQVQDLFVKVNSLKKLFDHAKYVVDFSKKAAVFAFASISKEVLLKYLEDIESLQILELPTDMYENRGIHTPILQHNHPLVEPFEPFVKTKSIEVFDATALFATITLLVSAILLGDIGVGLLLIIVGLLFDRKKANNNGRIVHRIGTAIMIGGLFYGTLFYKMQLYPSMIHIPGSIVIHIVFWIALIFLSIGVIKGIQKITKNQR